MNGTGNLWTSETWTNATENYQIGNTKPYETRHKTIGELFAGMKQEYGQCISKCLVDRAGLTVQVGWVFRKREKYEDTKKPYIQETWVSVFTDHRTPYQFETGGEKLRIKANDGQTLSTKDFNELTRRLEEWLAKGLSVTVERISK